MKQVVLGLGGNIGNVANTLKKSITYIENQIGKVIQKSSLYKTQAWGVENQPDFINLVISIETSLSPQEVLAVCLQIEKELGREREGVKKWSKRIIDIDVLFYDDEIMETKELILPHPFLHERNFVLFPLAEILPNFMHPKLQKTVQELKLEALDNQLVTLLEGNF